MISRSLWPAVGIDRLRRFLHLAEGEALVTDRESIVRFLRSLLDSGKPAWQRLQAVESIHASARSAGLPIDAFSAIEQMEEFSVTPFGTQRPVFLVDFDIDRNLLQLYMRLEPKIEGDRLCRRSQSLT
jgi:hypothetical protein